MDDDDGSAAWLAPVCDAIENKPHVLAQLLQNQHRIEEHHEAYSTDDEPAKRDLIVQSCQNPTEKCHTHAEAVVDGLVHQVLQVEQLVLPWRFKGDKAEHPEVDKCVREYGQEGNRGWATARAGDCRGD